MYKSILLIVVLAFSISCSKETKKEEPLWLPIIGQWKEHVDAFASEITNMEHYERDLAEDRMVVFDSTLKNKSDLEAVKRCFEKTNEYCLFLDQIKSVYFKKIDSLNKVVNLTEADYRNFESQTWMGDVKEMDDDLVLNSNSFGFKIGRARQSVIFAQKKLIKDLYKRDDLYYDFDYNYNHGKDNPSIPIHNSMKFVSWEYYYFVSGDYSTHLPGIELAKLKARRTLNNILNWLIRNPKFIKIKPQVNE